MPAPKSVVKVKKNKDGCYVEYTSNVDASEYYLFELTRAALRDVAKFVKAEWKARYYKATGVFKKRTGKSLHGLYSKVYSSANTTYPRVEIGLTHTYKGKTNDGFYAYFQEFGTSKTKKQAILQNSVKENVSTIREIESKYLQYLDADEAIKDYIIDQSGGEENEDE